MGYLTCGKHGGQRDGRHCCDNCDACDQCEGRRGRLYHCTFCCGYLYSCGRPECTERITEHIAEVKRQQRAAVDALDGRDHERGSARLELAFGLGAVAVLALLLWAVL